MNSAIFLTSAIQQFRAYKELGDKTFDQVTEKDFYYNPGEACNNLAVIIEHLNGNMRSRWTNFLTEDGEKEWRNRDVEFEAQSKSAVELLELWEEGWAVLFTALTSLREEDLNKTVYIRTQPLTVIEAIHRQLTHYASHVGQIVYIGKMIKGEGWKSLSIEKGGSGAFNEQMKKG
ncbi:DUF1572 family protein [Niabella sp. CJ426]|jgi:hypothetical protein|uniref:DUF1572 family protein n=1 Tax=Niabella sp. CJ426 TaxID=3393740 RepID=UPI003CFDCBBF